MAELAMTPPPLHMWTVYQYPKDFPDRWVLRHWSVTGNALYPHEARLGDSLEEVRAYVPAGCALIARSADDDTCIVETWI